MNTDNMALSGETIDYGPCAFIDAYDRDGVQLHRPPAATLTTTTADRPLESRPASPRPCCRCCDPDAGARPSSAPRRRSRGFRRPRSSGTGWPGCARKLGLFTDEADDAAARRGCLLAWMQRNHGRFHEHLPALSSAAASRPGRARRPRVSAPGISRWQTRRARQPQSATSRTR